MRGDQRQPQRPGAIEAVGRLRPVLHPQCDLAATLAELVLRQADAHGEFAEAEVAGALRALGLSAVALAAGREETHLAADLGVVALHDAAQLEMVERALERPRI